LIESNVNFVTDLTFSAGKEWPLTGDIFPIWIQHFSGNSEADVAPLHNNLTFAFPHPVVRNQADFKTFFAALSSAGTTGTVKNA